MYNNAKLEEALHLLGDVLEDRGEAFDIALIGGGALLLLGLIERSTKDLDILARIEGDDWLLARPLPAALAEAVRDVAETLDLADDWLNPGPTDLLTFGLPDGFENRSTKRNYKALTVRLASREDQIPFKLYAAADQWPSRSRHLADLRMLTPTRAELLSAAKWCRTHDPSDGFRDMLLLPLLKSLDLENVDV